MTAIKYLTIHCAATIEGRDHKAAELNRWAKQKFNQLSYHWIIELDGTMVRNMPDDQLGAHVGGHNTGNVGVCYVGGLGKDGQPKDTRTPEQIKTMTTLVRTYKARYPGIKVMGHRDWSPDKNKNGKIEPFEWLKACPCFDVKTWLEKDKV